MIYSFLGTGNSLWAAKELGRLLQMPGNCLISSEKENQMRLENAPAVLKKISESIQRK